MANIFGSLTLVALLITAFLASKNKTSFENELEMVQREGLKLSASQDRLANSQEKLNGINDEIPQVDARHAELVQQETEQLAKNEELTASITSKTSAIETNAERISEIREKASAFGEINQLAQKMRDLGGELTDLTQSIESNEAQLANLTSQITRLEGTNTTEKSILDGYSRGESRPGLRTSIRTVYPTWGFVTLNAGAAAGIAGNSTLNVVRGGDVVAKLLVTSVESGSASASIIPDSLSDDATLMVGDAVVPGSKNESTESSN